MFFPGETVNHTFIVPFDITEIGRAIISYKQNGHIIVEKEATSSSVDNENSETSSCNLIVSLTEKESLLFEDNSEYSIQINIFSPVNGRITSKPIYDCTGEQYLRQPSDDLIIRTNEQQEEEVIENE